MTANARIFDLIATDDFQGPGTRVDRLDRPLTVGVRDTPEANAATRGRVGPSNSAPAAPTAPRVARRRHRRRRSCPGLEPAWWTRPRPALHARTTSGRHRATT